MIGASALLLRLRDDPRGVTIVEFALVAPVMCLLLLGGFDISHTLYTRSVLQGLVQKAARDASLEASSEQQAQTLLDNRVRTQALVMNRSAKIVTNRRYYRTFSDAAAARAETYTDTNRDGTCNASEPYEDANGNGVWDQDGGNAGQGGAKDATLYTVTMTYPRLVPIAGFLGQGSTTTITTRTVLRNQPYADQQAYGAMVVRNCP